MILYLLTLLVIATSKIYTNSEAMTCFQESTTKKCKQIFDKCLNDKFCDHELEHYQRCHFGLNDNEGPFVFNGYCFRKWKEEAVQSKNVIDCLYQTCNLGYNSETGYQVLYKCSQLVMMQEGVECDDACLHQMGQWMGQKVHTLPLMQLYSQNFTNPQVANIITLLKKECLQEHPKKHEVQKEIAKLHQQWYQQSKPKIDNTEQQL